MKRQGPPPVRSLYSPLWQFSVRRKDGTWLTRPALEAGAAAGNMDPWTRRLTDTWHFDTAADASKAAISHGVDPQDFIVVPSPRRAGDWLSLEGDFAPKGNIAA